MRAFTSDTGTGEDLCTTPKDLRIALNNKEIDYNEATLLSNVLLHYFKQERRPIEINYTPNENCHTWGCSWYTERRIKINRPSVAILLHEVAHVLLGTGGHCLKFARTLDTCYGLFFIYLKTKKETK